MRNYILCCLLGLCLAVPVSAQTSVNDDLRYLFRNLIKAPTPAAFLYDMVVHGTNKKFYRACGSDTSTAYNWWELYFEMYYSAYDTTTLTHYGNLKDRADTIFIRRDTIPIGIFDFAYNQFKDSALSSGYNGIWFAWNNDSIWNDMVLNPPGYDVHPYKTNNSHTPADERLEIFAASALSRSSDFRDVVFRVDPDFRFYNVNFNPNIGPNDTLEINFGDGPAWHNITTLTTAVQFNVTYPDSGEYIITVRVRRPDAGIIKCSKSLFYVKRDEIRRMPDSIITNIPGLQIGIYRGCNNTGFLKPIIYLGGIDPNEDRNLWDIYRDMIRDENLVFLRNYGYDFVVVDWQDSKRDMAANAMFVVELIERLKCWTSVDHQFIVIGESMGGVIGRYALRYMETSSYQSTLTMGVNTCDSIKQAHNTRLFISIDAPHQGAFIPPAAQHLWNIGYDITASQARSAFLMYDWYRRSRVLFKNLLDRTGVKQLLIYHVSTYNPSAPATYTAHAARTSFMSALTGMGNGGWPANCKIVALTNGLIDSNTTVTTPPSGAGSMQVRADTLRVQPGDLYLDMDFSRKYRFSSLWEYELLSYEITANALPPQPDTGIVLDYTLTMGKLNLVGSLLAQLRSNVSTPSMTVSNPSGIKMAHGVIPYDGMPGGYFSSDMGFTFSALIGYTPKVAGQVLLPDFWLGYRYILNASTPIPHFCFIPRNSSLDYSSASITSPAARIFGRSVDTIMARTPFDVIVGFPSDNSGTPGTDAYPIPEIWQTDNFPHLFMRNDDIDAVNPGKYFAINREVGDMEMRLDNQDINRRAVYQTRVRIWAGSAQSDFYHYPVRPDIDPLPGTYSREGKFEVNPVGGDVTFIAGEEIKLKDGFEARQGAQFRAYIDTMPICYFSIADLRPIELGIDKETISADENNKPNLYVYPNPSSGSFLVRCEQEINSIRIFNLMGEEVLHKEICSANEVAININGLANGLYLLVVSTSNELLSSRVIINTQNR